MNVEETASTEEIKRYAVIEHRAPQTDSGTEYWQLRVMPPLKFTTVDHPGAPVTVRESRDIVVIKCFIGEAPRIVIHCAEPLKGEHGVAYGGFGHLTMDYTDSMEKAMALLGYEEDLANYNGPSSKNRVWLVWPRGSDAWVFTHSASFACAVRDREGLQAIIEFERVDNPANRVIGELIDGDWNTEE
jgi:hypothetical protein